MGCVKLLKDDSLPIQVVSIIFVVISTDSLISDLFITLWVTPFFSMLLSNLVHKSIVLHFFSPEKILCCVNFNFVGCLAVISASFTFVIMSVTS